MHFGICQALTLWMGLVFSLWDNMLHVTCMVQLAVQQQLVSEQHMVADQCWFQSNC